MTHCPYCKDFVDEQGAVLCPSCEAAHHAECWAENGYVCSVFGCEMKALPGALGCPWCDEVYIHGDTQNCLCCGDPLMPPEEFLQVLESTEWVKLELGEEQSPMLSCGFLRNNEVTARLEKRPGVAMLLERAPGLYVARDEEPIALRLLAEQAARFRRCEGCGHVLSDSDDECSYCIESGAEI